MPATNPVQRTGLPVHGGAHPPEPILSPPQAAPSPRPAHAYNPNRTEVLDKGRDPHWLTYSLPGASPCLGRLSLSVHICPHGFTSALYPKGSSEPKVTCYGLGPGLWWLPAEVGQEGLVQPPRGKGGLLTRLAASLTRGSCRASGPGPPTTGPGTHDVRGEPAQGEREENEWPGWDTASQRAGEGSPPHTPPGNVKRAATTQNGCWPRGWRQGLEEGPRGCPFTCWMVGRSWALGEGAGVVGGRDHCFKQLVRKCPTVFTIGPFLFLPPPVSGSLCLSGPPAAPSVYAGLLHSLSFGNVASNTWLLSLCSRTLGARSAA